MSEYVGSIPSRLQEIIEDFSWREGQEKLELPLEFSEKLPPLPDWLHDQRDERDFNHSGIHETIGG